MTRLELAATTVEPPKLARSLRGTPDHPKGDLNIFLVILSFFRPFRYGKNDLSRSRGILFPGAPIVSMVVYVVIKSAPKLMASASGERIVFYKNLWSIDVVALAASAH